MRSSRLDRALIGKQGISLFPNKGWGSLGLTKNTPLFERSKSEQKMGEGVVQGWIASGISETWGERLDLLQPVTYVFGINRVDVDAFLCVKK